MAMPVEKTSLSSASSARSPLEVPYNGPDRLSKLPSELLDAIFALLPFTNKRRPHNGPICKTLLPFQRRQYHTLTLTKDVDVEHAKSVLAKCDNLSRLFMDVQPAHSDLLAALSNPSHLEVLSVRVAQSIWADGIEEATKVYGLSAAVAPCISKFTALKRLHLDCAVDLSASPVVVALHQTHLEELQLQEGSNSTIQASDLIPLLSGPSKLPYLQQVDLSFTCGERGQPPEWFVDAGLTDFDDCENDWLPPTWPKGFSRKDLAKLVEVAEVEVTGTALEAPAIEDEYAAACRRFEVLAEEYWEENPDDERLDCQFDGFSSE